MISKIPDLISSPVTKAENTNALIFDSYFDPYRGGVASVRVFGGEIKTNSKLKLINSKFDFDASEIGYFDLKLSPSDSLSSGEVGYIVTGAKELSQIRVGDTLVSQEDVNPIVVSGYKEPQPT